MTLNHSSRQTPAVAPVAVAPADHPRAAHPEHSEPPWVAFPAEPQKRWFRQADRPSAALRLCALAMVGGAGPISGLEALNRLAPVARRLGELPPTFPLLHELEDEGHLSASSGLPRMYQITASGKREALRLAAQWAPLLTEQLGADTLLETLVSGSSTKT